MIDKSIHACNNKPCSECVAEYWHRIAVLFFFPTEHKLCMGMLSKWLVKSLY